MRYNEEIEAEIIAQIRRSPDAELFLPDWAYWKGVNQPHIFIGQMRVPLVRVLYEKLVGPLEATQGLRPKVGTSLRSVNPNLWRPVPGVRAKASCPNGHEYTDEDWINGKHRCHICYGKKLTGGVNPADVNRAKMTCPQGHKLVRRKNGRRRCRECPRAQTAAWRAKKEKETKS